MASVAIKSPAIEADIRQRGPHNLGRIDDGLGNEIDVLIVGVEAI